jgi:GT2 family glycosyltransferase
MGKLPSPNSQNNLSNKINTTYLKTDQLPIDPDQRDGGLATYQTIDESTNNIFIVNTDDKVAPQLDDGLLARRKNQIASSLGNQAELVSVVVQAFNRFEKTKMCVECILKYTIDIEYELVLVDNGSTEETLEYFKSVRHPRKKIIRVTKNIGSFVPAVFNQLSGRYLALITNDTYVTQDWLTNLLTCLKSEDAIGMVVPVLSNGGNLQGVDFTFNTLDEMQKKAAKHNVSNPALWHERFLLLPLVGLYKREALELAGGIYDTGFIHDFADNDLTLRIHRAGYKTMLCKDTFVHHDHIRTFSSEKDLEKYLRIGKAGRKDFKSKYFGIDGWNDITNYEPVMMSLVKPQEQKEKKGIEILGVDVLCGTPILELKNKLREARAYDVKLSAFSTDPKYWLELKTICTGDVIVDRMEHINEHFADERFDYIVLGISINAYRNPLELLQGLLKRLKGDGHLLVKLRNTYDAVSLFKTLGANININNDDNHINNPCQLSVGELLDHIQNKGFVCKEIVAENWSLSEQDHIFLRKAITAVNFHQNPDEVFKRALVQDYIIDIARK